MRMPGQGFNRGSHGLAADKCVVPVQNRLYARSFRKAEFRCATLPKKSRGKSVQICEAHLTHDHTTRAATLQPHGKSQQERVLAYHNVHDQHDDDDHEAPVNDSTVHKVLAWLFSKLGLLQLAAQLRGKAWNAITIACLMAVALLTAWLGGAQFAQANLCQQISTAATASIYLLAGIPELVDLCFDLTAGHIDTHVLMTLAVFGTLAIGGALEVKHHIKFAFIWYLQTE